MKKILALLLSVILCFSLSSCFAENVSTDNNNSEKATDLVSDEADGGEIVSYNTDGKTCYYYKNLTDAQKEAYAVLYNSVMNFEEFCIVKLSESELDTVWNAVLYDNPEIFWTEFGYEYRLIGKKIKIIHKFTMSKEEADELTTKVNAKVDDILQGANRLITDFDKELYFHDYICSNSVYDIDTLGKTGHTIYGMLLEGRGICEGYARCMQLLLDKSGISNYLVVGNATSDGTTEPHMWNIVEIDGENYHLDATWDDIDDENEVGHSYFNLRDNDIAADHTDLVPKNNNCNSVKANYFHKKNTYITSFSSYKELIEPAVSLINEGQYVVEFRFENKSDYDEAIYLLEEDYSFFRFVEEVSDRSGNKIKDDEVNYIPYDELNSLCIMFLKK